MFRIVTADVLTDETNKALEVQVSHQNLFAAKGIYSRRSSNRFEPYLRRGVALEARGIIMYELDGKGGVRLDGWTTRI